MMEQPQNSDKLEHLRRMKQAINTGLTNLDISQHTRGRSAQDIISRAVQNRFRVGKEEGDILARQMTLAPKDIKLKVGNQDLRVDEMQHQIAMDVGEDLQFMLADSYEQINSESTSSREYYRWIDETEDIIKHMNDGFVSEGDLRERNDFLDMSYQREMELMVCISLYQNSVFKEAKEKANELSYKLMKLRQMRSMIKQTTKDKADRKVEKNEYEKALEYYRAAKELKEHDLYWNLPENVLQNLGRNAYEAGINHGYDDNGYGVSHARDKDLQPNFVWYDWLREQMVRSMSPNQYQNQYDHSMGEMLMLKRMGNENRQTRENLAAHIERLSGRRPPLKDAPEYNYSEVRKRAFDMSRFRELQGREL